RKGTNFLTISKRHAGPTHAVLAFSGVQAVRRSPALPASSAVDHTFSAVLPYSCMLKMQGGAIFFKKNAGRVTAILALKAGKIDGKFTFVYK
ncbi:MAG: hypothetical protein PUI86_06200, partial [Bacteroidales bacterium]|nr:hypothetical protein [Bacteroidales bacterium]